MPRSLEQRVAALESALRTRRGAGPTRLGAITGHDKATHDDLGLDHGSLSGLADDDHTHYLNTTRHDADDHASIAAVFQSWTPTLTATTTDPTLGSGSVQRGDYVQVGAFVIAVGYIEFGSSPSAGSGTYRINLPVTAALSDDSVGHGRYNSTTTAGNNRLFHLELVSSSLVQMFQDEAGPITAASPEAPAASAKYRFSLMYEAA